MTSGVHPAWPHLWSHLWSLEGKKGTFMTASAVEEIRGLPSFTSVANLETTEQSMLPQGATLLHAASAGAHRPSAPSNACSCRQQPPSAAPLLRPARLTHIHL